MNRENQFLFLAGRQVLSQEKIDTIISLVAELDQLDDLTFLLKHISGQERGRFI